MSLLCKLVVASACRNTHHRLAMDALRQLRGPNADLWRTLFLKHYESYLLGSKAPDDQFKDFKNHVLHVADNFWGGAPATARIWYERTLLALRQQLWSDAAYSAGVLSHYYSDPLMPFHTGQTEEEGKVHRAAEWSIACDYNELQNILERDFGGYPDVAVPTGAEWLQQMVRQGALFSHPHYTSLIEHYDLAKGAKDPLAGLDQEIKDRVAQCLGYAAVGIGRILERAFAESAAVPPAVDVSVETFLATLKVPLRYVTKKLHDDAERALVNRIYDEVRRTGKCLENLPADDQLVRRLHAEQVLKMPLDQLDAMVPRSTGQLHGIGAAARKRPNSAITKPAPAQRKSTPPPLKIFAAPASIVAAANGAVTVIRAGSANTPWKRIRWSNRPQSPADPVSAAPPAKMPAAARLEPKPVREVERPKDRSHNKSLPVADAASIRADAGSVGHENAGPKIKQQRRSARAAVSPPPVAPETRDEGDGQESADDAQTLGSVIEQKFSRLWSKVRAPKWIRKRSPNGAQDDAKAPPPGRLLRESDANDDAESEASQSRGARHRPDDDRQQSSSEPLESNDELAAPEFKSAPQQRAEDQGASAPDRPAPDAPRELRFYLDHDSPLEDAPSIGPKMAKRFAAIGVETVEDFLALDPDSVATRLGVRAFDGATLRDWQAQARLACRVPEIRSRDSQVLVACGVTDPDELATMDPDSLFELVEPFLATPEASRILRDGPKPDLAEITDWIQWARHARPLRAA